MKVEIICRRNRYPILGEVLNLSDEKGQALIDSGLAKLCDELEPNKLEPVKKKGK